MEKRFMKPEFKIGDEVYVVHYYGKAFKYSPSRVISDIKIIDGMYVYHCKGDKSLNPYYKENLILVSDAKK